MPQYRYVGNVAREIPVGDTRPMLSPGDFIELKDDEVNKTLIDEGLLLLVATPDKETKGGK